MSDAALGCRATPAPVNAIGPVWTPDRVCARLVEAWCETPRSPASAHVISLVAEHLVCIRPSASP